MTEEKKVTMTNINLHFRYKEYLYGQTILMPSTLYFKLFTTINISEQQYRLKLTFNERRIFF